MGTFNSFRKAYGVLKDSTKVGLAKVNSEFKDLDIAIVKATNHDECPPKERHLRRIFSSTSALRPRADVSYCIHMLSKRLAKTGSWIVALKTLVVVHRALREGDPTFREELLNYSSRGRILQISNFKDDSSPLAWDCSSWVRTYALFLEERLECFRILKYDIEAERLTKVSQEGTKVHSRTRLSSSEELLEQLPALQQLLYRLVSCQPQGLAFANFLIQYALTLVLKESFKIYCAINDGIINLVDMFFDMPKHNAVRALNIYKRASHQAEYLADFYEFCKGLDLARNFQFPTLRQSPPSFLATMEEYIREAPQTASLSGRRLEFPIKVSHSEKPEEKPVSSPIIEEVEEKEETDSNMEVMEEEPTDIDPGVQPPLILSADTNDLLALDEINLKSSQLEESNALALSIVLTGEGDPYSPGRNILDGISGSSGWELALVTAPTRNKTPADECKMGGGFDKMLLDSLYEDEVARRQIQVNNSDCSNTLPVALHQSMHDNTSSSQALDPFFASTNHSPPFFVQMTSPPPHQLQLHQQQQQHHQYYYGHLHTPPPPYYPHQHPFSNPFGDPLPFPPSHPPLPLYQNHTFI